MDFISLVAIGLVLLILDVIWLKFIGGRLFARLLKPLMREGIHYGAAAAVYLLMTLGLWVFVWGNPNIDNIVGGFLFGVIMYGVYEGTNYATLKNWPKKMIALDVLWGGFVSALTLFIVEKLLLG